MESVLFQFEDGLLNSVYDKIYNCKVVKPVYEVDGLYSNSFMLDKREGTSVIPALSKPWYTFYDVVTIWQDKYYLATQNNKYHIFHSDGTLINQTGIEHDTSSPIRFLKTNWAGGDLISSWTLSIDWEATTTLGTNALFDGGYIKLNIPGCAVWQYIVFGDWLLKGTTNRIDDIDWNNIYIIWTNSRGTIPVTWEAYRVYEKSSQTLCIGSTQWLYLFHLNWNTLNDNPIQLLTNDIKVIDFTIFNSQILALTEDGVYYSRTTFDGNTNIYPRDMIKAYGGQWLVNIGTAVLLFWDRNMLIKDIIDVNGSIWYVAHELQLTSHIHSKYAYIYKDWVFMMLTDKSRLPIVNIQNINNTLSRTELSYTDSVFRGLLENISGEVYGNEDWVMWHMITHDGDNTTIYELDFEYKHWIIQKYHFPIYKKINWEILWKDWVYAVESYTDLWETYSQEVNLSHGNTSEYATYSTMRITSGKTDIPLNLKAKLDFEFGVKIYSIEKVFKEYKFEEDLNLDPNINDFIWEESETHYHGTFASLQKDLWGTGRYMRLKYTTDNRFIFGPTMLILRRPESKISHELNQAW